MHSQGLGTDELPAAIVANKDATGGKSHLRRARGLVNGEFVLLEGFVRIELAGAISTEWSTWTVEDVVCSVSHGIGRVNGEVMLLEGLLRVELAGAIVAEGLTRRVEGVVSPACHGIQRVDIKVVLLERFK